jgi:hypothetical protein
VFDYDHDQREALIARMQKKSNKLVELESIVDLFSMVLYNGVKSPQRERLEHDQQAANRLYDTLLGR